MTPRTGDVPRILMVGADAGPTFGGDAGTYAILVAEYGQAASLGDEGVFYTSGDASVPEDAEVVDVVFISSTLGSGAVRDKFEDAAVGVLNHEQALMQDDQTGNFFMVSAAQTLPGVSQLTIVDPGHPLVAGLEGVVDVFTSAQTMSVGIATTPADLAPDAFVVAEVTSNSTLKGIYAIEEGGGLLGDGSPGRPDVAPGPRVMFFLEDQGGNVLTPGGQALLIAAMDWLAEGGPACERPVEGITRSIEPPVHEPGETIRVTLAVRGVAGQVTIEETFPDHLEVTDAGGGSVDQSTITFSVAAEGDLTYALQSPAGRCATSIAGFSGGTVGEDGCRTTISGESQLRCTTPGTGGAPRILMVGADPGPTFGGDGGTYAILTERYGAAASLGDEGVFYTSGNASAPEDAELVDVVFISSTLDSGSVRNKFEDARAGVLNHEQALMQDDQSGNFFMVSAAQTLASDSQLTIVDPDHPLAAGLEDVVDVFTAPQTMSVGIAFGDFDLAPDAFVIAEVTSDSTLKGIYAIEEGGGLLGDGSPGSPDEALGRRVMFFLEDQGGNFLTAEGKDLLIAAVDWLADLEPVEPGGPEFVRGDADGSGALNISDGILLLSFLFSGDGSRPPCGDAADTDDSGTINLTDAVYVLNYLFGGDRAPPAPHPDCGEDPTADEPDLGCETPPAGC